MIILHAGNYNFFNFLYIGLCISLLDDGDFGSKTTEDGSVWYKRKGLCLTVGIATLMALGYLCFHTFYSEQDGLKVVPTRSQFDWMVKEMTHVGLGLGALSMVYSFGLGLLKCLWPQDGISRLNRSFKNFL